MTSSSEKVSFTVIVLGDLGHSPRITNQALSISKNPGTKVHLVGYKGSNLSQEIIDKDNIHVHYLFPPPTLQPGLWKGFYILYAPFKAMLMFFVLLFGLFRIPYSHYIMIQNPPAIPTLAVVQLLCFLKRSLLIVDWHNFGYSILALKFGQYHPIVKLAYFYEWCFGRVAHLHITVTQAMARELKEVWKVKGKVIVLYDRAPQQFYKLKLEELHDLFLELEADIVQFKELRTHSLPSNNFENSTLLTSIDPATNLITFRPDRPRLLVSSTSWTPDEDFGMFLKTLLEYESLARENPTDFDKLVVVITGKGPDKQKFDSEVQQLELHHVQIKTVWLPIHLYPKLLGAADIGISLHASSSGLDLPMKVVDMLGAGLPVCALDFECMSELITHNYNGLVFSSSQELTNHLVSLFSRCSSSTINLQSLEQGAEKFGAIRWETYWDVNLKPHLMIQ